MYETEKEKCPHGINKTRNYGGTVGERKEEIIQFLREC